MESVSFPSVRQGGHVLSFVEGFPRLFGRYALLTSFGRGGMGEVFLAKQRVGETSRLCVVKTLRGDLADSREYIGRFKDEAHVVVQLNHAHISQVYEYGVVGTDHFLVMEFIHGVNLRELLQDQQALGVPLEPGLAILLVSTTLDALAYAHRLRSPTTGEPLRVVHRDVSPANVMVGFEGDVKLIDFGLAESALKQEQTETRAVMGKVGYMSPEQARGEDVDGRCDQFAAAVMLYEAVVGDRFYGDWNTHQIWQRVGVGGHVPRRWGHVPEPLRPVLARALDADPARRYPDCDAFRDDVDEVRARLAPRANKSLLRETLRRLYAARIEAEGALIARFAHVLPPAEGQPSPPSEGQPSAPAERKSSSPAPSLLSLSLPSLSLPRSPPSAASTEPFLTSPSQPAGLPAQPGRVPGDALDHGAAPVPPPSSAAAGALGSSSPPSSSSSGEPTVSSRAIATANPAARTLVAALVGAVVVAVVAVVVGGLPSLLVTGDEAAPLADAATVVATAVVDAGPGSNAPRSVPAVDGRTGPAVIEVAGTAPVVLEVVPDVVPHAVSGPLEVVGSNPGSPPVDGSSRAVPGARTADAGRGRATPPSQSRSPPTSRLPPDAAVPAGPVPVTAAAAAVPGTAVPPGTTGTAAPSRPSTASAPSAPVRPTLQQLTTEELVARTLACAKVPPELKSLLGRSQGEQRRVIALAQLQRHCPPPPTAASTVSGR